MVFWTRTLPRERLAFSAGILALETALPLGWRYA